MKSGRAMRARYGNMCKISDFLIYWREYEGKKYGRRKNDIVYPGRIGGTGERAENADYI